MAESNLPECVICTDSLLDPRALPCGHSFCGPGRNCIQAMELPNNRGIRCSVCMETHNIKASDLRPLYGIREFFQEQRKGAEDEDYHPPNCEFHGRKIEFWCKSCEEGICSHCLEDNHDGHSVCAYLNFMKVKVSNLMGRWEKERKRSVLEKELNQKVTEIDSKISAMEAEKRKIIGEKDQLQQLNEKWGHLDKFAKNTSLGLDMDVKWFLKYSDSVFGSDDRTGSKKRYQAVSNHRRGFEPTMGDSRVYYPAMGSRNQLRRGRSTSRRRISVRVSDDDCESDDIQSDQVLVYFNNVKQKLKSRSNIWSREYDLWDAMFKIGLRRSAENTLLVIIEGRSTGANVEIKVEMTLQVKPRRSVPVRNVTLIHMYRSWEIKTGYNCDNLGAYYLLNKIGRLWLKVTNCG